MKVKNPLAGGDREILHYINENTHLSEAILALYQQNSDTVYAYIANNSGTRQDAEDIFQETIIIFLNLVKEKKFRGEASIKTFLVAIARNLWLKEWNKRGRTDLREKIYEEGREQVDDGFMEIIQQRETQKQLLKVLDKLREPCKKLLQLYYYENHSMNKIITLLSYTSEQIARNKKYKCMKELTDMLRQNPDIARQIREKLDKGE